MHEIETFPNGTASVRDLRVAETMHSSVGAETEARQVYLEPSRLMARLQYGNQEPLVLFDVGMGIAANSCLAFEAALATTRRRRPLVVISFENDLSALKLALSNSSRFPWIERNRLAALALLEDGIWQNTDRTIRWELRAGDFLTMPFTECPELIYYDFFSPKVAPELWTESAFSRLRSGRAKGDSTLLTYSASTQIRVAMLAAGFYVGRGPATPIKRETTIACTGLARLESPLDTRWLDKLDALTRARLSEHPQFRESPCSHHADELAL